MNPEKEQFGVPEGTSEEYHIETTTVGDKLYDVGKLREFEKDIPETEMPLGELTGAVSEGNYYWIDRNEEKLSPYQILKDWEAAQKNEAWQDHVDTIKRADLTKPIWLTQGGHVFDGAHRLTRAFIEGQKTIKVKIWDNIPDSALADEEK